MIEQHIEQSFIDKLTGLKYEVRSDIRDRAALEKNFREKFEALNRVRSPMPSSPACTMKSSHRMSSPLPRPCAASMPSPATTAHR
jgi:hypothetical protein